MAPADAIVRVDTLRNILIMRGTRSEAEGWMDVVRTFDVNLLRGMSVGVFPLQYASPLEVQSALAALSGGTASAAAAARLPAAPAGAAAAMPTVGANALGEGNPLFGALRIMPLESINSVLVITPRAAYLDEVQHWISKFDRPNAGSTEPQLFVYKVKNGAADHLAELLNGIYGGYSSTQGSAATGVAPGLQSAFGQSANRSGSAFGNMAGAAANNAFATKAGSESGAASGDEQAKAGTLGTSSSFGNSLGSSLGSSNAFNSNRSGSSQGGDSGPASVTVTLAPDVRVMADRINNTLLIYAPPAEFARIEATLKRLDVQRAQVLIEASIIEVTLSDGDSSSW